MRKEIGGEFRKDRERGRGVKGKREIDGIGERGREAGWGGGQDERARWRDSTEWSEREGG